MPCHVSGGAMRTCVVVLASISVLSGCATLKNTPQQDDVWELSLIHI